MGQSMGNSPRPSLMRRLTTLPSPVMSRTYSVSISLVSSWKQHTSCIMRRACGLATTMVRLLPDMMRFCLHCQWLNLTVSTYHSRPNAIRR